MSGRSGRGLLLAAGGAALLGWAWWCADQAHLSGAEPVPATLATMPPAARDAIEPAPDSVVETVQAPQQRPAAHPDIIDTPFAYQPAAGASLALHFADLRERALAGEAAAALRLHDDISWCRQPGLSLPPPPPPIEGAGQSRWLERAMRRCVNTQRCRGVVSAQLDDPVQWLWRAAEAGDIEAQVRFASGEIFEDLAGSSSLDYLQRWQQSAAFWIEHAAAQGHPRAMLLLGQALAQHDGAPLRLLLGDLLPDDPVRGHALLEALSRSPNLAQATQLQAAWSVTLPLTALQQTQAQQQADMLFAVHSRRLLAARPEQLRSALQASRYASLAELREQSPSCVAELDAVLAEVNAAVLH